MDGNTPTAVLSQTGCGCLVTMTLDGPAAHVSHLAGQCNAQRKTVNGKGEGAQFYDPSFITVFNTVAFVYQGDAVIRKVQLVGSNRGMVTFAVTAGVPNVVSMVAISEHKLAILGPSTVRILDVSPTISCKDNSFLAGGLAHLNTELPSRAEMYLKYSKGIKVSDDTVWTFTGYRKVCVHQCLITTACYLFKWNFCNLQCAAAFFCLDSQFRITGQ